MRVSRILARSLLFLAALLLAASTAQPQQNAASTGIAPATMDSIRSRIRFLLDSAHAASISLAVTKGGKIIWEEGFGYADVANKVPATANTLYSMASISKPIATTGLMRLVEQGKVDLDKPANDYLGAGKITGLAGNASGATVRRVASHTAGLPLHYRFFYDGGSVARPTMDEAINRYAIVVYPPGLVYNYSNLGYGVLEEIIARVSGKSFEQFMHDEVFVPLGMPTTLIGTGKGFANSAVRYYPAAAPVAYYDFDHRAASAVYTSAHELVRFGMFHLKDHLKDQKPILKDATLDRMHTVATPGDTANGYGLGWGIDHEQGSRVVSHTGGMPGVATSLKLFPEHDIAIAVLANASGGGRESLPHRIILTLAGAIVPKYDAATAEKAIARFNPTPFTAPVELQGEWAGAIRMYDGSTVPFALTVKSDDVHVRLGDRSALWTVLNQPNFRNNLLGGRFAGTIPSDEQKKFPQSIGISIYLNGGKLQGWAASLTSDEPLTGAMSSYVELTKRGVGATK